MSYKLHATSYKQAASCKLQVTSYDNLRVTKLQSYKVTKLCPDDVARPKCGMGRSWWRVGRITTCIVDFELASPRVQNVFGAPATPAEALARATPSSAPARRTLALRPLMKAGSSLAHRQTKNEEGGLRRATGKRRAANEGGGI